MTTALRQPSGNLATLGISKEIDFGTFVVPSVFHIIESVDIEQEWIRVARTGAGKHRGKRRSLPAVFKGSISIEPEADVDTIGQILAFALGAQTTPVAYMLSTTAKTSTLSLGAVPSFSTELNRVTDALDLTGCKISQLDISVDPQKALSIKAATLFRKADKQVSPTTPTYSTKVPPLFNNPGAVASYGGVTFGVGGITLQGLKASLKNNLIDSMYPLGEQYASGFDEKNRDVSGSLMCGFETDALYDLFVTENTTDTGDALSITLPSTSIADATNSYPYSITFTFPNVVLTKSGNQFKSSDLIYQNFTLDMAESSAGANDDMTVVLVNTASAVY